MEIKVASENALIIYFGDSISPEILARVQQAAELIEQELSPAILDLIPSYASLVVVYDSRLTSYLPLRRALSELLATLETTNLKTGRRVTLPVYYSEDTGPDLHSIARQKNLTIDEVVRLHSNREYRVYAIGFAPGFAYLGELDHALATPRLQNPRLTVPRGSVAIANRQTAVYPNDSPGGWNLIGRCPTPMFDSAANPPMPVSVGDTVVFSPISRDEYLQLGGEL